VRRAPPFESSFANLLLNIQDENEKVVFTIVHEKAGKTQLHRAIGRSGHRLIEKQEPRFAVRLWMARWSDDPIDS